jgi:hypothetical protein
MAVPFDIRASDEFETSWQKYSYQVGPRWQEFDESVLAAVDALTQKGPGLHVDAARPLTSMVSASRF